MIEDLKSNASHSKHYDKITKFSLINNMHYLNFIQTHHMQCSLPVITSCDALAIFKIMIPICGRRWNSIKREVCITRCTQASHLWHCCPPSFGTINTFQSSYNARNHSVTFLHSCLIGSEKIPSSSPYIFSLMASGFQDILF